MTTQETIRLQTAATPNGTADELLQLVSFTIGQEEFALDIVKVREINRMTEITRIPNAPAYVSGIINLRGRVIPIVDLRARFGFQAKERDKETRIIVVEIDGKIVGFVVDAVNEVLRIPRSITEPPPAAVGGVGQEHIRAVGKLENRLLILLDVERLLSSTEQHEIAQSVAAPAEAA